MVGLKASFSLLKSTKTTKNTGHVTDSSWDPAKKTNKEKCEFFVAFLLLLHGGIPLSLCGTPSLVLVLRGAVEPVKSNNRNFGAILVHAQQ